MLRTVRSRLYALSYLLPLALVAPMVFVVLTRDPLPSPAPPARPACDDLHRRFEAQIQTWNESPQDRFAEQVEALSIEALRCADDPRIADDLVWALRLTARWEPARAVVQRIASAGRWPADLETGMQSELDYYERVDLRNAGEADAERLALLRHRLEATSADLLQRWPEWPMVQLHHYSAVSERSGIPYEDPPAPTLLAALGRWARSDGALVVLLSFPPLAGVMLGLALRAGYRRAVLEGLDPTVLAQAQDRYVAIKARLGVPPGYSLVRHPRQGIDCIWHPGASTTVNQRSVRLYAPSAQPVLVRDALGARALLRLGGVEVEAPAGDAGVPAPAQAEREALLRKTPGLTLLLRVASFLLVPTRGHGRGYLLENDEVLVIGRVYQPEQGAELPTIGADGNGHRLHVFGRGIEAPVARLRLLSGLCFLAALLLAASVAVTCWQRYHVAPRTPWSLLAEAPPLKRNGAAVPASSSEPAAATPPPG